MSRASAGPAVVPAGSSTAPHVEDIPAGALRRPTAPGTPTTIRSIDSHTAGEPTRVVFDGIPPLPGDSVAEQRDYFADRLDHLRTAIVAEPRGHRGMFGAVLTEPSSAAAALGAFFLDSDGYLDMCVHGSIGVVTVALQKRLVVLEDGATRASLETPAGLVPFSVCRADGRIESVTVRNVPCFVWRRGIRMTLPSIGGIEVDVAYGGNWFALVDVDRLGLELAPESVGDLVELGMEILDRAQLSVSVRHPTTDTADEVELVGFFQDRPPGTAADTRSLVVFGDRQFDRSPCGSWTCARMATLYADGRLARGREYSSESVIGTRFRGRVVAEARVGSMPAVIPEITGGAWIVGDNDLRIDDGDPLAFGFRIP